MFCSCYFSVFLCRVLALVLALKEEGVALKLKALLLSRLLCALLIDKLNLLG